MSTIHLPAARIVAAFCCLAALMVYAEDNQESGSAVLFLKDRDEARSYFRDLANTKSNVEFDNKYLELLRDLGVFPLLRKGNVIPIHSGGQILLNEGRLTLRNHDETSISVGTDPVIASVDDQGKWTILAKPNRSSRVFVVSTGKHAYVVNTSDSVFSKIALDD